MTRLQDVRKATGMSQSELAKAAEMPVRTLQALEAGARNIDNMKVITVLKLAHALGCEIEDILEWSY